jgi:hypothetical protein
METPIDSRQHSSSNPSGMTPETEKLVADARRAEAERRKIEFEIREIEKRLSAPFYYGRLFVQAGVGGVVASALLAAWLITYMQPIINRKQEIASLDAAIQAKTNERDRLENQNRTETLARENKTVRDQLESLSKLNSSLLEHQNDLEQRAESLRKTFAAQTEQLMELATKPRTSQSETQELAKLARTVEQESKDLRQQIAGLQADRTISEARARQIDASLTVNTLRETTWRVTCPKCSRNLHSYYVRLRGDGAMGYNYEKPSDFKFDGTDAWNVTDGKLTLIWSNGFSNETYTFESTASNKAQGTKSNIGPATIEKVG